MVKDKLVMRRRKSMTAMMMTKRGYRLTGGVRSVWLEHSSLPLYKFCRQEHVSELKYCPGGHVCLC